MHTFFVPAITVFSTFRLSTSFEMDGSVLVQVSDWRNQGFLRACQQNVHHSIFDLNPPNVTCRYQCPAAEARTCSANDRTRRSCWRGGHSLSQHVSSQIASESHLEDFRFVVAFHMPNFKPPSYYFSKRSGHIIGRRRFARTS